MDYWDHFGIEHLIALGLISLTITAVLIISPRLKDDRSALLIRLLAVILFVCEITQDVILVRQGWQIRDALPLHLCNLGIFVNLPATFGKRDSRLVIFFSEISAMLILPGALGALLFPDWNYRPILSWLPVMCFFTHMLEVLIPLMLLRIGRARIRLSHFHYSYVFLATIVPFIYILDRKLDVNYMFLMTPTSDSPLKWVADLFGERFYLLGLALLLTSVLAAEYSVACIVRRIQHRN